ncbi:vacuolar iron transporter homolog 2.1-like [Malus domestica]|uniref:vacuolar iron transporter homolog 2.1-like n=1 Tax=Malus domestica TaxID=3750 RepID=UPI0039755932
MDTSHQTLKTPVEHKLPVTDDENYTKTEQAQRAQWLRAALLVIPSGNSPSKLPEQPEKARKITAVEITQFSEGEESLPSSHQAASASALAFLCGSLVPLHSAVFIPQNAIRIAVVVVVASIALAFFGGVGGSSYGWIPGHAICI